METSKSFQRTVKIQYHRDATSGGGRAKLTIPVRIQLEAGVQNGNFMEWAEQRGRIVGKPVFAPSLHTTTVFPSGRDQLYCLFPGVFWKKYHLEKGAEFHWRLKGSRAQGFIEIPAVKPQPRPVRAKDTSPEATQTVYLLRHQTRYRSTVPVEFCRALSLSAEHFVRWQDTGDTITCTPVMEEAMDTTGVELRKSGTQVEIPNFLCKKYDLFGKSCAWMLKQGILTGTIRL